MAAPDDDPEKTRLIRRPARAPQPAPDPENTTTEIIPDSEMTRLIGPPRRARPPVSQPTEQPKPDASDDPVVGWVVIVGGPGKGNACRLGYGQNNIGRERDERVCLDFGDEGISRSKHCYVIYDPRERQYTLRPGESANLTYLNGKLLSESKKLKATDKIEIGHTTLRFVPLCGPDFEWQDQSSPVGRKSR